MPTQLNPKNRIGIILAGFFVVTFLLGSAIFISKNLLEENSQRIKSIVNENIVKQSLLIKMNVAIRNRMLLVYDMLQTKDPFDLDELILDYENQASIFISNRKKLIDLGLTAEQTIRLEKQKKLLGNSGKTMDTVIARMVNNLSEDNSISVAEIKSVREINRVVLVDLEQLFQQQTEIANHNLQDTNLMNQHSKNQVSWLIALSIFFSFITIIYVLIHIKRQGQQLHQALDDLAQHNQSLNDEVEKRTTELLLTKQENLRISAEVEVAQKIQEIMLPTAAELQAIKALDIAVFMQAAAEVGGDYIDVLAYAENKLLICIGDVTGHGLDSGLVMIMAQSISRHQSNLSLDNLPEALNYINTTLFQNIERMGNGKNLSLCLLDYSQLDNSDGTNTGHFRVSGQHESILIIRNNREIEVVDTDELGFPIGLIDDISSYCKEIPIELNSGDTLILYTDGVTEAVNSAEDFYGLDRFVSVCRKLHGKTAAEIKGALIQDIRRFIGNKSLYDDISLVVINQR
jgi:serine phosphatase RsbU (regulator of sigma subunit)